MMAKRAREMTCRTADLTFLAHPEGQGCLAKFGLAMVGILSPVTFGEAIACHVILCGQDPSLFGIWAGRKTLDRARDQLQPQTEIRRRHYCGDPRLSVVEISVRLAA